MSNCRQPGRDARAQAESQAQAIIAQGRRMARQRLEGAPLEEEPMKLLGAVNALTAATLSIQSRL